MSDVGPPEEVPEEGGEGNLFFWGGGEEDVWGFSFFFCVGLYFWWFLSVLGVSYCNLSRSSGTNNICR